MKGGASGYQPRCQLALGTPGEPPDLEEEGVPSCQWATIIHWDFVSSFTRQAWSKVARGEDCSSFSSGHPREPRPPASPLWSYTRLSTQRALLPVLPLLSCSSSSAWISLSFCSSRAKHESAFRPNALGFCVPCLFLSHHPHGDSPSPRCPWHTHGKYIHLVVGRNCVLQR